MLNRFIIPVLLVGISSPAWAAAPAPGPVDAVVQDLNFGRADDALQRLDAILAQNPGDAEAHNFRCRVYYEEEQWDASIADCEAAVKLQPSNSIFHLWLGRAYGLKAQHVSIVSGYKLAHKVAAEFQKAVELDPNNVAALSDLGEFDAVAPGVAGGGSGHATPIIARLQAIDPAAALTLQARIAENHRDYPATEDYLKNAIARSSDPADAWMNLAAFYRRRKRIDDMIAAVHNGAALDGHHGPALVDGASDLTATGRELDTAIQWLQQYLSSHAQSEEAPAFAVHAELAKLLSAEGNIQAAQQQIAAARALASDYRISNQNLSAKAAQ